MVAVDSRLHLSSYMNLLYFVGAPLSTVAPQLLVEEKMAKNHRRQVNEKYLKTVMFELQKKDETQDQDNTVCL